MAPQAGGDIAVAGMAARAACAVLHGLGACPWGSLKGGWVVCWPVVAAAGAGCLPACLPASLHRPLRWCPAPPCCLSWPAGHHPSRGVLRDVLDCCGWQAGMCCAWCAHYVAVHTPFSHLPITLLPHTPIVCRRIRHSRGGVV
jgi:hypothetical protein